MPRKCKIAEYDSEALTRFWIKKKKKSLSRKNIFQQLYSMWYNGIWSASRIPIYLYLASYYAVNLSIIQTMCSKSCELLEEADDEEQKLGFAKCNNTTFGYFDSIKSYECSNYKTIISNGIPSSLVINPWLENTPINIQKQTAARIA